jgi:Xaa-Pro aminopeptidase
MNAPRKHQLIEIEWPEFGVGQPPPPTVQELQARVEATRSAMEKEGLTHLVVYGDREHFANVLYLTGFDPRFEEAILIVSSHNAPLLLVGNECEGYLTVSPSYVNDMLRAERFQPFSLLNQPRDSSRYLKEIFTEEGIGKDSTVGCAGWKYFSDAEHPDAAHAIEIPAYVVDTLRDLAGWDKVVNATAIFRNPDNGLRATCSHSEIAYFEYANTLASEGMKRLLFGIHEGMIDYELAKFIEFNGIPLGCHLTLVSGDNRERGLSSPIGAVIRRGDPLSTNYGYWGSNICRAGWVASSASDLTLEARDYVENFAGLYFEVMSEWFSLLRIGTPGDHLARLIEEKLPSEKFGIFLNPGHLTHMDEWVSSPIYEGSRIPIQSGMVIQVDVIPSSNVYFSTRMEDGVVIADESLRRQLQGQYPESYSRCQKRQDFMRKVLGIELPKAVLPLSNIPAIVPPFLLEPNTILAIEP